MDVNIVVKDLNGSVVEEALVYIGNESSNIKGGHATFENIEPGERFIMIQINGDNLYMGSNIIDNETEMPFEINLENYEVEEQETEVVKNRSTSTLGRKDKVRKILMIVGSVIAAFIIHYLMNAIPLIEFTDIVPTTIDPLEPIVIDPMEIFNFAGAAFLFIFVFLERKAKGQIKDAWAAMFGVIAILFSKPIIAWSSQFYSGSPEVYISFMSGFIFVISVIIVYIFAVFVGGTDLSAPGGFWGILALFGGIVVRSLGSLGVWIGFSNSYIFTPKDIFNGIRLGQYQLVSYSFWVYAMILFSLLHFLYELLGLKREKIRERNAVGTMTSWNVRWPAIIFAILQTASFFALDRYTDLDPWYSLMVSLSLFIALAASTQDYTTGVSVIPGEGYGSQVVGKVMAENSWDSVAFGLMMTFALMHSNLLPLTW